MRVKQAHKQKGKPLLYLQRCEDNANQEQMLRNQTRERITEGEVHVKVLSPMAKYSQVLCRSYILSPTLSEV
jgi:hypothetical protein